MVVGGIDAARAGAGMRSSGREGGSMGFLSESSFQLSMN